MHLAGSVRGKAIIYGVGAQPTDHGQHAARLRAQDNHVRLRFPKGIWASDELKIFEKLSLGTPRMHYVLHAGTSVVRHPMIVTPTCELGFPRPTESLA